MLIGLAIQQPKMA